MKIKDIVTVITAAALLFGFCIWSIAAPDAKLSVTERRPLASMPQINAESIADGSFMSDFEKYTLDTFPLRDSFRALKAFCSLYAFGQRDNNGIYFLGAHTVKTEYPYDRDSVLHAADRFGYIYTNYLTDKNKVYLSVIPDKNYFAPAGSHPQIDYAELLRDLCGAADFAQYIDIFPLLGIDDYYRTDTHWRAEKIYDAAASLAAGTGTQLPPEESFSYIPVSRPFYGVYYGQAALPVKADEMYLPQSDEIEGLEVFDFEDNKEIPVYNMDKADGTDLYEIFLSGPKSLLTLENPANASGRELILFRDSFGSSIAPLLATAYSKVTLVDIRYISPALLGNFIDFGESDVMFLYSTSVLNNSITIK